MTSSTINNQTTGNVAVTIPHPDMTVAKAMRARFYQAHQGGRFPYHYSTQLDYTGDLESQFNVISSLLPDGTNILRASESFVGISLEIEGPNVLALAMVAPRWIRLDVAGIDRTATTDFSRIFEEHYYEPPVTSNHIRFGWWTSDDLRATPVKIDPEPWPESRDLYPDTVASDLDQLMALGPDDFSKSTLVFFTGEPGTGKTSVIKSLMTEWKGWANFDVITDPEAYMNDPGYRAKVMRSRGNKRWRVVVLDDADAFIQAQKVRSSSMTSLLNAVDGLVASQYPTLHLFTCNLRPGDLEPALVRDGRCRAIINFEVFAPDEASEKHGRCERLTLARLKNTGIGLERIGVVGSRTPFGFN